MLALSILELGRVRQGSDRRDALDEARSLGQRAEAWGYRRMWVAEHHNMAGVTTAATSIVIAHIAAGTKTLRVGAGGIMLPNHAPYVIAEQFGTLAARGESRGNHAMRQPRAAATTLRKVATRRWSATSRALPNASRMPRPWRWDRTTASSRHSS